MVIGLRRARRGEPALRGVDLSVSVGARLLLASEPDGAASLLLRVLAGLVRPSGGQYRMAGVTGPDAAAGDAAGWARRVGYVASEPGLYPWLTPREALDLAGRLAGMDGGDRRARTDELLRRYRLEGVADRPMGRGGPIAAQKTALATAMLNDPEILLLDDPLRSIEPDERTRLLHIGGRRTVLLASRYPASEAGLVNQVALLREGRLVLHAGIADLYARRLPLSMRGITALANDPARRRPMPGAPPASAGRPPAATA